MGGRIILKLNLDMMRGSGLAQDKDQWWDVVNTIMNIIAPLNMANFYICTVHSQYESFFIKIQLMHSL
jgi:hypothetical protein